MNPSRPARPKALLKKFLENDRKVLRFYCVWDDSDAIFGDVRNMILHYFLADDTIEIREHIPANSGRDGVPNFLKRSRLPKESMGVAGPGETTENYYTDRDLFIGCLVDIYGRKFIICDADDFTKEYYAAKYGIDDFAPLHLQEESEHEHTKTIVPPYNGFGSEEDSLGSCTSLIPKPPKKNFQKLFAYDNIVLRFGARLNSTRQVDKDRRFVISCYLADESLLVFEPFQRNSGILGGKFLERTRIKKPDSNEFYGSKDLFIGIFNPHLSVFNRLLGAEVVLLSHHFILNDADDYALSYMEAHAEQFPVANAQVIEVCQRVSQGANSYRRKLPRL